MTQPPPRPSARERLLSTASELFYQRGINHVGINEVTERAGVARQSLYNNFESKEALVRAVLAWRSEQRLGHYAVLAQGDLSARERLLAIFDLNARWQQAPNFRGCAFVNATIECGDTLPAVETQSRDYKRQVRELLTGWAQEAGAQAPAQLAGQLALLLDGTSVTALLNDPAETAQAARAAAETLIAVACGAAK